MEQPRITLTTYSEHELEVRQLSAIDEALPVLKSSRAAWLDVCGVHDAAAVDQIGRELSIHPLVLEDILHTDQRVKVDEFEGYLFLVIKDLALRTEDMTLEVDQVSLILTPHCLLTFQERPGDSFDAVRKRLESGRGRMRKLGVDYLAYALLDAIVDSYFVLLEQFGDKIEDLEEMLMEASTLTDLAELHRLRRDMLVLRRAVWPLREVLGSLERHYTPLITDTTRLFLRDLYDHVVQVIDAIETSRDLLSSMVEIYLSNVSNRMNEVMKTLTAITAIFIPLTFLAGVYGMNFENMPELEWRYSYFVLWGLMLTIAATLTVIFRRKKWI